MGRDLKPEIRSDPAASLCKTLNMCACVKLKKGYERGGGGSFGKQENNSVKRAKQVRLTGHLVPFNNFLTLLRTLLCYFSALSSCRRTCERCVRVYAFHCSAARLRMRCMYAPRCRSPPKATHPCLLSSSGSGPVELERGAQLLLASEDFILRTRGNKTDAVSTTKNGATSPQLGAHNISAIAQKQ